jgi:hypothetical protein
MKTIPQINHNKGGPRCDNSSRRSHQSFPLTEYNHRATAEPQMSSSASRPAAKLPAFHKLSSELFGAKTSPDYIAELLFFILITGISAWPIISAIVAVTRLVRNY